MDWLGHDSFIQIKKQTNTEHPALYLYNCNAEMSITEICTACNFFLFALLHMSTDKLAGVLFLLTACFCSLSK